MKKIMGTRPVLWRGSALKDGGVPKRGTALGVITGVMVVLLAAACQSPVSSNPADAVYKIKVEPCANGTVSAGKESAKAGETITLNISPDEGYKLDAIRVNGSAAFVSGAGSTRSFTMPAKDVTVTAAFIPQGKPDQGKPNEGNPNEGNPNEGDPDEGNPDPGNPDQGKPDQGKPDQGKPDQGKPEEYAIIINAMENGGFESFPDGSQFEGSEVRLIAIPGPDYKYHPGSLQVTGKSSRQTIKITDSGTEWVFKMPGENVEVDAAFVRESVTLYDIVVTQTANGSIECGQTKAVAGDMISISLAPQDEDYRYKSGSLIITPAVNPQKTGNDGGYETWMFTMPEETVHITAKFEMIPFHTIIPATMENGTIVIAFSGTAREGDFITITAIPNPGYKWAGTEPFVKPADSVTFTKDGDTLRWSFYMTDNDLEIGVDFTGLGPLEIYRGGVRKGIRVGELSDDPKYFVNSIELEAEEPGHGDNQRVLKISQAVNQGGNTTQQSFGLFSDTPIDLENVAALSFWVKANKTSKIRFAGFGDNDPDKRVVYIGENYNHDIPVTTEWKHHFVPMPAAGSAVPGSGLSITRVFLFNASVSKDTYIYIDDIEFIQSGVTLTGITIPDNSDGPYYGTPDHGAVIAAQMLKGANIALTYTCDDGTIATLQNRHITGTLKYNLAKWLIPFITINGNVTFSDGIIFPKADTSSSAFTLSVRMDGISSNAMNARIINGILLDDFEDMANAEKLTITATPGSDRNYLWHTTGSGSTIVDRDYITTAHNEIHWGQASGSWRPSSNTDSMKLRGGRNFNAKDASGCTMLTFWVKVTTGGNVNIVKNAVLSFELKNGGTLTSKSDSEFTKREFTYNPDNEDGWQNIIMPLSDFIDAGLDHSAITGYAFGVVDNKGAALRVILDDIALY